MTDQPGSPDKFALRAIALRIIPVAALVLVIAVLQWRVDGYLATLGFFGPLLLAAGLWLVVQGLKDRADHRAVERLRRAQPPRQGAWTAVAGAAVALEPEAPAPFDNLLAYRYQVLDEEVGAGRGRNGMSSKFIRTRLDGYYLVPTGIDTGSAIVALSGFPDLIHLDKRSLPGGVHARAAEKAVLKSRFVPAFMSRIFVTAHARDRIDLDIRYGEEPESGQGMCKSWVLLPGDQVCVFGIWNNGALIPSATRPRGLPVYAGGADEVAARLKDDSKAFFIVGAALIGCTAAWALWSVLW